MFKEQMRKTNKKNKWEEQHYLSKFILFYATKTEHVSLAKTPAVAYKVILDVLMLQLFFFFINNKCSLLVRQNIAAAAIKNIVYVLLLTLQGNYGVLIFQYFVNGMMYIFWLNRFIYVSLICLQLNAPLLDHLTIMGPLINKSLAPNQIRVS